MKAKPPFVQRKDRKSTAEAPRAQRKNETICSNSALFSLLADLAEHLPLSFSQVDRTATAAYIWPNGSKKVYLALHH
jgi:hypothetical protein